MIKLSVGDKISVLGKEYTVTQDMCFADMYSLEQWVKQMRAWKLID